MNTAGAVARASVLLAAVVLVAWVGTVKAVSADPTLLVSFAPGTRAEAETLIHSAGARVLEQLRPLPILRVSVSASDEEKVTAELRRREDVVVAVDIEGEQVARVAPNDSLYRAFQWNLRRIGMERAWDLRPTAADVIVGVLDTGVDLNHSDLRPNLMLELGYNFLNDTPTPQDDESHGTAVAGIIGAVGNNNDGVSGIAWRIKLLPVKALNAQGRGPDSAMVKAILHAADNGARVINISSTGTRYSTALETAVRYAQDKGALVVAAAGNTGDRDNAVNYPAAFPGVVAVAAIDDHDQLAPFSQRQPYVTLAAPGTDVPSTAWSGAGRGPYASQSGTSIAAPHVAGAAALLWGLRPDLEAGEIVEALRMAADRPPTVEPGYGAGILNVARAAALLRLGVGPRTLDAVVVQPDRPATGEIPAPPPLPSEQRRWYFAEGSTQTPFEVSFALHNPNPLPTIAHFLFLSPQGRQVPFDLRVGANSRATLDASMVMPNAEFATIVTTDLPVYVERSMYFGHDGHSAVGARQPARTWYLAEGSTVPPFETWVLLLNPNNVPTQARLRFLREDGSVTEHAELVPPMGRRSIYVNALFVTSGFATQVTSDQPIVVERAMYFDQRLGGHDTLATSTPAQTWYLAAGASRGDFDTWVLVENPGNAPANVRVSFMTDTGSVVVQPMFVLPHARASLFTNPVVPNAVYGMRIDSDQPVVVERAVYFDNSRAGFDAAGVPTPATEWYLPEGSTTGSFQQQLAVLNPQTQVVNVLVEFRPAEGEPPPPQRFSMAATSRVTLDVNPHVPDAHVSMRITADRPIVVERTSYFARTSGLGATTSTGLAR